MKLSILQCYKVFNINFYYDKFENEFMKKLNVFTLILTPFLTIGAVIPAHAFSCRPSDQSILNAQNDNQSASAIFALVTIKEVESFVVDSKICNFLKFKSEYVFDEKNINQNEISFCYENKSGKNLSSADLQQELDALSDWTSYLLGWEKERLSIIGVTNQPPIEGTFENINFSSNYRFIYSPCYNFFTQPILNEKQKLPMKQIIDEFQPIIDSIKKEKIVD